MPIHAVIVAFVPCLILAMGALALCVVHHALSSVSHALVWAGALALGSVQTMAGALPHDAIGTGVRDLVLLGVGTGAALLFAEGFRVRRRGGAPSAPRLAGGLAIVCLLTFVALLLPVAFGRMMLAASAAGLLLWAATMAMRPGKPPALAERAVTLSLTTVAFVAILTVASMAGQSLGLADANLPEALRAATAAPVAAGGALFVLLLIASDFSEELQRLVHTDPLTGVLNREGFEHAVHRALRRTRPLSLAIADIDRFKAINDVYGHAAGDSALACVASHLARSIGKDDIVARIGGEEFALLLRVPDGDNALDRVDPIRRSLSPCCSSPDTGMEITASFGIAEHRGGEPLAALFERADAALYRSKREGRNRTTLADAHVG